MYHTVETLVKLADEAHEPLWRPIARSECALSEMTEEALFRRADEHFSVMEKAATQALERGLETAGNLITGIAADQHAYAQGGGGIGGPFLNRLAALALSCSETNAAMGKICAAPTAGACGILPAVLISVGERYSLPRRAILEGLITASGIGAIITRNATVSGAQGGCQAECGVAAAMASAAAVQMAGGSNGAAAHAVSLTLMNCMGLVCDPIAGLVQVPCAQRNAGQAVSAILSADLALAGMVSVIPADEVIEAMFRVGKQLPAQLRETAMGGLAATPSGKEIAKRIFAG